MALYLPSDSVTGGPIDVDLLADYLELTAFFADDATARGSDLVNAASLAAEDRDGVDGEIRHGPQTLVERGANRIRQRQVTLGSAYPFELGQRGEIVTCRVDDSALGPAAYVLSLVLSHLRSVSPVLDGSNLHPGDEEVRRLRQYFQGCATAALAAEVQGAAWSFGFPRPDGSGFLEKLEQIWRKLRDGTVARQVGAPDRPKDDHIDVFAARTHPDGLPGFLLAVAQVATGANWRQKSLIGHQTGFNSLWQKSIDRSRPESTEWRRLGGMAMGKKPAARQPSPMWVTTADLPTSAGHPFFERLNRVLEEAGFDAFVEGLCAVFYASRLGRPSLRPGRYFRLLFIGYFEGLSSERGIAWRVADSLSLRAFLDLDVTEAPPNHSTLSRTRRLIDVETHVAVFTWVLERLAGAGLVQGKTVGVDATTLEANAAMRSIERRDTGESYEAFVRQLAKASGIETPTRAELARFDRSRKDRKTSNKEWQSPQDPDAKIAKMKDGRTHLAHKAEHGVDLETGAILSVTVQDASEGDSATLPETLTMAAEQVEAVQPAGAEVEEVVADKGYHSDATLVALDEIGVRSYVSEPERGRRCWQDKKTGETPAEKRAAQKALYGNRRRIRGDRGRRLQRRRGELVERPFAHQYETGGLRRVWVRGHENVRKRVLIQAAGCNLGLLLRRLTGVGTPRSLQGRALSAICGLIGRLTALWGRLTASWDFQWTPAGLVGSIAHRQAA